MTVHAYGISVAYNSILTVVLMHILFICVEFCFFFVFFKFLLLPKCYKLNIVQNVWKSFFLQPLDS